MERLVDWSSTTMTVLRAAGSKWTCAFAKFPPRKTASETTPGVQPCPASGHPVQAIVNEYLTLPCRCGRGHREPERRAAIGRGFGPDFPAVALEDALHDRQPDAAALEFRLAMQALERAEQLRRVLHVEADAVVAHEVGLLLHVPTDIHPRAVALARILERVADEIGPDLADDRGLAFAGRHRIHLDPGPRAACQVAHHLARQFLHGKRDALDGAAPELRQAQQALDQVHHALGVALDHAEQALAVVGQARGFSGAQQMGEPADRTNRRAQVVRYRVGEGIEFLQRAAQLDGALRDALLELDVDALVALAHLARFRDVDHHRDEVLRHSVIAFYRRHRSAAPDVAAVAPLVAAVARGEGDLAAHHPAGHVEALVVARQAQ